MCFRCFEKYDGPLFPGRIVLLAPNLARPRFAGLHDPNWPWYVPVLDSTGAESERRRSTSGHPGTKRAFRPTGQPLVNRWSNSGQLQVDLWSTVYFVPPSVPGHALHKKGVQRQQTRRSTGHQPRTKSTSRPVDKPLMNRWATVDFVPPSVYIRFRLFVLLKKS